MNQAKRAHGSFLVVLRPRRIAFAMKFNLDRVRYTKLLASGLALLFSAQIAGLCFCAPTTAEEHDCCPLASQTDVSGRVSVADVSAPASTSCCPEGGVMRASLRIDEPEVSTTQKIHATVVHAGLPRNEVPAQPHHTGSAPAGRTTLLLRSPILRI